MLLDMQIYMPTQDPLAQPDIAFSPRQVKKWIKSLSLIDLDAASEQLHKLIAASNRQSYPVKQRYASMELLQDVVTTLLNHHRRFLSCQTFPLSPNASETFQLQQSLNAEIAIAYKIIISEVVHDHASLDNKKLLHCLFKAVIHLQNQYISSLLMYQEISQVIWHDICQLYRVAEHYGIYKKNIVDDENKQKTTISNLFKQLCASTLISFNQLRQGEADKVSKFLQQHHALIDISNSADNLAGEHIYIANLATGKKPAYYVPREIPISTENRFISYSELVNKLAESTKKYTQSTSFYLQSHDELDPELAGRLIAMIGNPTQRHKKRIQSDQPVNAVIGLSHIIETMNPTPENKNSYLDRTSFAVNSLSLLPIEDTINHRPQVLQTPPQETLNDVWNPFSVKQQTTPAESPLIENTDKTDEIDKLVSSRNIWHIENFNAGGFCLHYKADGVCTTRVGEVIAVRDEQAGNHTLQWRVGIIRWMQGLANKEYKIGVELFGAQCACVTAHNKNNTQIEYKGLLLKRIFDEQKSYSLLLPANSSLDSREITIEGSNSSRTIMLGRSIEKTGCFSHMEVVKIFDKNDG